MDSSHEGFVKQVLTCTDEFSPSQIRAFVEGEHDNKILAEAFGAYLSGDGGKVLKILNPKEFAKRQGQPEVQATPA